MNKVERLGITLALVSGLAACGKMPSELGYVPVPADRMDSLSTAPMTAIVSKGEDHYTAQVDGIKACFQYYQAKSKEMGYNLSTECVGRDGQVAAYIRNDIITVPGKLSAPDAVPQ